MAEGVEPVFSQPPPAPPSPPANELRYRQPHPQHQLPAVRYNANWCNIITQHLIYSQTLYQSSNYCPASTTNGKSSGHFSVVNLLSECRRGPNGLYRGQQCHFGLYSMSVKNCINL